MGRLSGRTVIVTGGARGIGASYAKAVAAEGANVAVCDILDPGEIVSEIGAHAWGGVCDVADAASVRAFVTGVLDRFGRIDGLVNNAALFASLGKNKPFDQIDSEEFDRVMQINVRGVFECCKAVMPTMREQSYGKIVNISSGTFFKGTPGKAHYVASKGAVIALTRVIARETGRDGVRVNCVAPGFTLSEGVLEWGEEVAAHSAPSIASRCIARDQQPEDLNGAVVFLLSAESDFISGQTLAVDGGSVIH
ncbi:SDR family NAD(P)-dependent oxidoreductase [Neorhizobium sp. DT-125]|uniref:SDR family NAD(P)-dependent oxidoreductase n=1 Tax=Neorhizobium sp. DT-125 TaxID=3396163 RepID=UPI003F1BEE4F